MGKLFLGKCFSPNQTPIICNHYYDIHKCFFSSGSDSSDDEEMQQRQVTVMDKIGVVENAFLELTHEHQLGIKV